ncbi:hypothetical protein [Moheibacter lacus]|uniref:HEXXH motif-containing protein n=1 Tax=Moheibacter lacus TaxID=2745851 RepID=A0A838ZRR4_9FLAO|nr:hypothetical protein [Moheibacter lacus]MBA5629233.1 hypothetical protein [Moheibacter lacus]
MDLEIISKLFYEGQTSLVDAIKRLLYKNDQSIFEKIDFYNDQIYLDPLLYSYFTLGSDGLNMTLEQILYSFLPDTSTLNVISDKNGIIYLPNFGYLSNVERTSVFAFDKSNRQLFLKTDLNSVISYVYEPINNIEKHQIELCIYNNPYFDKLMQTSWVESGDNFSQTEHKDLVNNNKESIEKALEIIRKNIPSFYQLIIDSTKKIFLYENSEIRSFVTKQCHGAIFLSVDQHSNINYFLEELLHQCGHNIFNAVTFDVSEFLQVSENTNLGALIGNNDSRTIYGALHGVFTVSSGTQGLYEIYKNVDLENDVLNEELMARLAIKSSRFRSGIEKIDFQSIFTEKGKYIYDLLDQKCEQIINDNPDIFNKFDFSNQPHVFSYEKFKQIN